MVPSEFVFVDALPRTPNGKVDVRALPEPEDEWPEFEMPFAEPRTPAERAIAEIWTSVLGTDRIGIHDNFFEIGGDSILSIRIISRANQAGFHLSPAQLLRNPTVAGLASVVGASSHTIADQGPVEGSVPLTPIQRWFFEQSLPAPHHWNHSVWLDAVQRLDADALRKALKRVALHHDVLRLSFRLDENGWTAYQEGPDATDVVVHETDLSDFSEPDREEATERADAALQQGFKLSEAPLIRCGLFQLGDVSRILLTAHHLVVDIVSWQIIFEDLATAYRSIRSRMDIALPTKTTSFKGWSKALGAYARSGDVRQDEAYWLSQRFKDAPALPMDENGAPTEGSIELVKCTLSEAETQGLLHQATAAYGTRLEEVLLTALVQTFTSWTGHSSLLIDIEGHGREDIGKGLDVSRTVGWFTSLYPVVLSLVDDASPGEALKSIKEQLRRVPHRGLSYGLTRYLGTDTQITATLDARRQPRLLFNYGGRGHRITSSSDLFRPFENFFSSRASENGRAHPLEFDAVDLGGRLELTWAYSSHVYRRATIERLASNFFKALNAIVQHCASPEAGGYTPSDFPDAGLSQQELDRFLERLEP